MELALGLLETKGLIAAIEAADAMAKAADIKIICKEKSTATLVTIKIVGDTAAVRSALDAGALAAGKVGQLVSVHLIPHPDDQIDLLVENNDRIIAMPLTEDKKKNLNDQTLSQPQKEKSTESETSKKAVSKPRPAIEEQEGLFSSLFDNDIEEKNPIEIENLTSDKITIEPDIQPDDLVEDEIILNLDENENVEVVEDLSEIIIQEQEEEPIVIEPENTEEPMDTEGVEETSETEPESTEESATITYTQGEKFSYEDLEQLSVSELRHTARSFNNFPIKGREISKANKQQLLDFFRQIM